MTANYQNSRFGYNPYTFSHVIKTSKHLAQTKLEELHSPSRPILIHTGTYFFIHFFSKPLKILWIPCMSTAPCREESSPTTSLIMRCLHWSSFVVTNEHCLDRDWFCAYNDSIWSWRINFFYYTFNTVRTDFVMTWEFTFAYKTNDQMRM